MVEVSDGSLNLWSLLKQYLCKNEIYRYDSYI